MTWATGWLAVVIAPIVGSFAGVLIRRLPRDRPVLWSRSACESCGHTLGLLDLVPVASYAALRGRCRRCFARIAPEHLAIELAATIVALLVVLIADPDWVWPGCVLAWGLLTAAWIDAETFWLPDALTLPLILVGLVATWLLDREAIVDRAAGAVAAWAGLRGIGWLYARLRHREGLGEGDAKLLAVGGAWLGWQALPWLLLTGAALGLLSAAVERLRGRSMSLATAIPFGPPLAAAIFAIWLTG